MGRKIISKFRKIASKIFTLSYPKYRFFIFLGVLILLKFLPFYIIEKTHNLFICYATLGKYCYSVGITRGVSSLLRGDLIKAIEYNFLSIIVLIILIIFIIIDFYKGFLNKKIK
jgi:hypothetical protein